MSSPLYTPQSKCYMLKKQGQEPQPAMDWGGGLGKELPCTAIGSESTAVRGADMWVLGERRLVAAGKQK